jgi:hypothetical protein
MTHRLRTDTCCRFPFRVSCSRSGCHLYVILDMKVGISEGKTRSGGCCRCCVRPSLVSRTRFVALRPGQYAPATARRRGPAGRRIERFQARVWCNPHSSSMRHCRKCFAAFLLILGSESRPRRFRRRYLHQTHHRRRLSTTVGCRDHLRRAPAHNRCRRSAHRTHDHAGLLRTRSTNGLTQLGPPRYPLEPLPHYATHNEKDIMSQPKLRLALFGSVRARRVVRGRLTRGTAAGRCRAPDDVPGSGSARP